MKSIKPMLNVAAIFLLAFLLVSCSAMGLPSFNAAKGKIKNGVYTGKIGIQPSLGTFSVKVPQANNDYEFTYMQMKEQFEQTSTYVSFGPAAFDLSIFRVIVGVKPPVPFAVFKQKTVPMIAAYIGQAYGQPIQKIYETDTTFKGYPALYAVYTQSLPNNRSTLTHGIYYVAYGKYVVVLWTMGDSNSGSGRAINDSNRNQIINRTWQPEVEFVNSFRLNN